MQQIVEMEMTPGTGPGHNINHMKEEEEKLIQVSATNRHRVLRNNLYLVSFLNAFTIIMFIFSMTYYRWLHLELQQEPTSDPVSLWVNLLYVYDGQYLSFWNYTQHSCKDADDLCTSILEQLSFVGTFCFVIMLVAHALQLIDIFVFLYRVCKQLPLTASNFFRQVFVICTFVYGLMVYLFSATIIRHAKGTTYGVCIYMNIVSILLLVAVVVYEQISIRRMIKAELVLELLEGQKKYNGRESDKYSVDRNSDSFVL